MPLSQTTHTHMHTYRIHTDLSRENKSMLRDLFQQLSDRLTVSLSALHSINGSFCVYLYSGTKGQLKSVSLCVCGEYSIPLLFLVHSHTNPGLLTLARSEITQIRKKTQSHYTQRAWESLCPLPRVKGELNQFGKKPLPTDRH